MLRYISTISVVSALCVSMIGAHLPMARAATVAETTLSLLFPEFKPGDNLAVDPGDFLGSYLIAYFARQDHTMYSMQDARRKAIALGLIDPAANISQALDSNLLRNLSYRHRILFNDDPVANVHGHDGDINRHITSANYPSLKVINDHLVYYDRRVADTTLPPRLAETLYFRKLRFEALKTKLATATPPVTTTNGVLLKVPFYKQQRSLSCEMASLRSLLAYYGIDVAEDTLITQLGVALPLQFAEGIWGDPQEAFVGNINGAQSNYTGYGTYWKPVARVGKLHKPELEWFEGGNLQTLTASLDAGHPVQIWTVVPAKGGFMELRWKTQSGQEIVGLNGEHTWIVDGYKGTAANPTSFHVVDPYFGSKDVTTAELQKQWARFNNSGVKVR